MSILLIVILLGIFFHKRRTPIAIYYSNSIIRCQVSKKKRQKS
ncbi:hypothetical protein RV00_GL002070 [Enterococcus devriesei]|uniref:Uncharacterized protein n=1 Tax=Enterococcus devriesei TaxID=319970 RepID=A0A1L8SVD8_9ENTE|nr:hypothetical protein RV00_GL002070 [Enterococcus devriesei]